MAALITLLAFASNAGAHASYVGYSGAPGSNGRCAASCHGGSGGTIQVTGFPSDYAPSQVYAISISHSAGVAIKQFNGSCRIGTGSANAGTIQAGTNTATYNTSGETNGIHLSAQDLDSGSFQWTAPPSGTGEVRLYVAGHQGSSSGANTTIVLIATEQTADVQNGNNAASLLLVGPSYPNPFSAMTTIAYTLPQASPVLLEIFDASGRRLESRILVETAGPHRVTWDGGGNPSGAYFYRIQAGPYSETRKMLLSR